MDNDVRIADLEAENAWLRRRLAELQAQVAALSKNSRTSSKPPSSGIVKPAGASSGKGKRGDKKRKPGGQPRYEKHTRVPFAAEQVDRAYAYDWANAGVAGYCWAHLIRDIRYLTTLGNPVIGPLGEEAAERSEEVVQGLPPARRPGPTPRPRRDTPTGAPAAAAGAGANAG